MADKKITELDDLPIPASADLFAMVDDVAGTATTKKATLLRLPSTDYLIFFITTSSWAMDK